MSFPHGTLGRCLLALCAAAALGVAPSPAPAAPAALQSTYGDGGLYLRQDGKIPVVERANGQRAPVPLRPGESISAFVELADGWLAAGSGIRSTPRGQAPRRQLVLVSRSGGPLRRLPPPPGAAPPIRQSPTPLVADGELVGLVWLEGADRRSLAVVAASWDGAAWGPRQQIAAPGPGSQLAPTAAVVDGTWTVAWSRFDGRDDEIYWSERRGEQWSTPRRAHARHAGPDATPALVAGEDGELLLSWMRFDGDQYRTVISRLGRSGWSAPSRIGSPASLFPSFTRRADRTYLLYRTAAPMGWTVTEVDAFGRPRRRAAVASDATARPVLSQTDTSAPKLAWPSRRESRTATWQVIP